MNPTKKIALILTVIFLLPAIFFSVYEISSLSKDEKMIEEIYYKQLEAIIFSVNQYSDDALNSWVYKVESGLQKNEANALPPTLQNLLSLNSSISLGFVVDTLNQKPVTQIFSLDSTFEDSLKVSINKELTKNSLEIDQLVKYKKSGFQKITPIKSEHYQLVIFIIEGSVNPLQVAGLVIDPEIFIQDVIGPRCQVIAKNQFVLSAFNKDTQEIVYSTLEGDTTFLSNSLAKDLWIFPDYSLGIRTEGASLAQLVQERTNTNLLLLLGLDAVLIVALILAFRSIKKEVQLAQNKSDFVSNVSHEIRTPLALISMFAETLEMGRVRSEEKKQEYYAIISKETNRLTGIVNKILSFSQTEAGKKTLQIETLSLSKEISEILNTYDFHLTNKGFEYSFEENPSIRIWADKQALAEMIINLIDNAIKYSLNTKRIEFTIGSDERYGWISVKDYGLGISSQDQKHIFDKFYRVPSGNLARSQGTGLGLSLVKQLIEQQNGKISVTSQPGQGSTFKLYFQLSDNING